MRITGVIPSRYESTRFPGKPLALIQGLPLIERVWRQAMKSRMLADVIVATDDKRIADAVLGFGGRAVMTSRSCASGTDRLAEVARKAGKKASVFINIQGDEPLIDPELIDNVAREFEKDRRIQAVTAAYPLSDRSEIQNPNVVKVVTDEKGCALYFSRHAVPFERGDNRGKHFKHIGIYGYRRDFLLRFASWKRTPLERSEQLEQLRILEKGFRIKVVAAKRDSFGVDVPEDVRKIEKILKKNKG